MTKRVINFLLASIAILAFSANAYAGCTKAQISGTWEVAFSNGNSCRIKLNSLGKVVASASDCFDPFRGVAGVDSGKLPVKSNCLAEGNIVVEGIKTKLAIQFAADRSTGGGRYLLADMSAKGSVIMIRLPEAISVAASVRC